MKAAEAPTHSSPFVVIHAHLRAASHAHDGVDALQFVQPRYMMRTSIFAGSGGCLDDRSEVHALLQDVVVRSQAGGDLFLRVGPTMTPSPAKDYSGFSTQSSGSSISPARSGLRRGRPDDRRYGSENLLSRKNQFGCPAHSTSRSSRQSNGNWIFCVRVRLRWHGCRCAESACLRGKACFLAFARTRCRRHALQTTFR